MARDESGFGEGLVNLVDRVPEIYRDPGPDTSAVYGWRYRSITTLARTALAAPLGFGSSQIRVIDLLPERESLPDT